MCRIFVMEFVYILLFSCFFVMIIGIPVQDIIAPNNRLTASIYKEVIKTEPGNILVSPLSLELVVALAQSGAKGETAQEIRTTLHLPDTKEETEEAVETISSTLRGNGNYSLHTANKIYVENNLPIKEEFKNVARKTYGADIENIDFSQTLQAAETINKWVEKHTENKIHKIIIPDNLESTAVILINALYFKAAWEKGFSKKNTFKQVFYKTSKNTLEVDFMHSYRSNLPYYENAELDAKFLKLPYQAKGISMIIALPNKIDGISLLENQIEKVFNQHKFEHHEVDVSLPKFKIDSTIDFKEILKNLGIKAAFQSSKADFSGLVGEKGDFYIDVVKQKCYIDVNEEGTEAAAVTLLGLRSDAGMEMPDPKLFTADHPFVFYIEVKGLILFGGKVSFPVK